MGISIHAPAEGATSLGGGGRFWSVYFNPRSRGGSDMVSDLWKHLRSVFQSTLPRRERRHLQRCCKSARKFQSTLPRRERQGGFRNILAENGISIHAPAEGATYCESVWDIDPVFQSTLPRRERHGIMAVIAHLSIYFNPRSRGGSDKQCASQKKDLSRFQSTLPRRERPLLWNLFDSLSGISIHAPAEGATSMTSLIS